MATAKKYLFDVSFDQAAPAAAPPAAPVETFSRDDVEAARATGYAEGQKAGAAGVEAAVASKAAAALETIGAALAALIAARDTQAAEIERRAIEALRAIVAKALPAYAAREPLAEIEGLASKCLIEAIDEPRIVIRVANAVYEEVRARLDAIAAAAGYGGRVVLLTDDDLAGGDARIEWADGGAERRLAERLNEVDAALARVAATPTTSAPPSA
jgi:flagellar assembly protein FliH